MQTVIQTRSRLSRLPGLMAGTAVALLLAAAPALAQTTPQQPETPPAAGGAMPDNRLPSPIDQPPGATPDAAEVPMDSEAPGSVTGADKAGAPAETILGRQEPGQTISAEVIGAKVYNPDDEQVGTVTGLVFDENDRIVAGIVSVGGILGLGGKQVAVNWEALRFTPGDRVAVAELSREQLEAAPPFLDREMQQAAAETERQRQQMERDRQLQGVTPPSASPSAPQPAD